MTTSKESKMKFVLLPHLKASPVESSRILREGEECRVPQIPSQLHPYKGIRQTQRWYWCWGGALLYVHKYLFGADRWTFVNKYDHQR